MFKLTIKTMVTLATVALLLATSIAWLSPNNVKKVVIATTTSLYDTGLLKVVEEVFEKKYSNIDLCFISKGTGLALLMASRGDVDAVIVHAPLEELSFMMKGYGVNRKVFAYNSFAILGPSDDPAGIRGLGPTDALKKIVKKGGDSILWVSRGDRSGTHRKEEELWRTTGLRLEELRKKAWLHETGVGMGATLLYAENRGAYLLSDISTYLLYLEEGRISLEALVVGGRELLNVYSIIASNPSRNPHVNFNEAMTFIRFLVSDEGQDLIANFSSKHGKPFLHPAVPLLKEGCGETYLWLIEYAFFNGTECPPEYRYGNYQTFFECRGWLKRLKV